MVEKIKRLCKDRHITVSELQRSLGLHHNAIARWDTHRPSVDRVKQVADFFGTTVDELLK